MYFQTFPQTFLCRALCGLGQAAEAVAVLGAIEPLVQASAHRPAWALIASMLGDAHVAAGDAAAAAAVFENVLRVADPAPLVVFAGHASRMLGELALARGDLAEAAARLAYGCKLAEESGARDQHGFVLWSLARVSRLQGDAARARAQFARAAELFDALGDSEARDRIAAEAAPIAAESEP